MDLVLRGRVLLPDGKTGLQGVQVVARRDGDEAATAVSGVSGYLYKDYEEGSRDVALQGYYELPALGGGTLRAEVYGGKELNPDSVKALTTSPGGGGRVLEIAV